MLSTATEEERKRAKYMALVQRASMDQLDKLFPNGHAQREDGSAEHKSDTAE